MQYQITAPSTDQHEAERNEFVARVSMMPAITTIEHHKETLELIGEVSRREKAIEQLFEPAAKAAYEAHRNITALRNRLKDPYTQVKTFLSTRAENWEREQNRKADEERIRREADLRRQEAERKLLEAEAAEDAGDLDEAESIRQQPIVAPAVHVPAAVAKVEGVGRQERWDAEVTDKVKVILWVAANIQQFSNLLDVNQTNLRKLAQMQRTALFIPGVKVITKVSRTVRT